MDAKEILAGIAAAAAVVWKHARAVAAEAVAAAEKRNVLLDGKLSDAELEQIAVDVVRGRLPGAPEFAVRWLIRKACAARKKLRPKID